MNLSSNLTYQFLGQSLGKALMLLFYVLLARSLGEEGYGAFMYALSICLIFGQPLVQLGLDSLVVKWMSREKTGVLRAAVRIRGVTSCISVIVVMGVSFLLRVEKLTIALLILYMVTLSFEELLFAYLRGRERMKLEGVMVPLQRMLVVALLLVLPMFLRRDSSLGALSLLLATAAGTVCAGTIMLKEVRKVLACAGPFPEKALLKEGFYLAAQSFLWLAYFRIDTFMLGAMSGDSETGVYNAAYRLTEGLFFLPGVILTVYFPQLSRKELFRETFLSLFWKLALLGAISTLGVYLVAPLAIRVLYAGKFVDSQPVLQMLSLAVVFVFLGHLTTQSLIALDMNRTYVAVAAFGALINILLNCVLIPAFGPVGAAAATVVTEAAITLITGVIACKRCASG